MTDGARRIARKMADLDRQRFSRPYVRDDIPRDAHGSEGHDYWGCRCHECCEAAHHAQRIDDDDRRLRDLDAGWHAAELADIARDEKRR